MKLNMARADRNNQQLLQQVGSYLTPCRALFTFLYIYVSFPFLLLSFSTPVPHLHPHGRNAVLGSPSLTASSLYRVFTGPRKHVLIFNAALSRAKVRGLFLSETGKARQRMISITKML